MIIFMPAISMELVRQRQRELAAAAETRHTHYSDRARRGRLRRRDKQERAE